MSVKIRVPNSLTHLTEGQIIVEVRGKSVGECLKSLQTKFPALGAELFDDRGKLRGINNIYLNNYPEGLNHLVKDGDELAIIRIIGGG